MAEAATAQQREDISSATGTAAAARAAILQAARQRFLHYGYKKTTIDEIASDANIGKGTVYLHFSGKDAILLTLVMEVKRNINAQIRAIAASLASPEDRLRRIVLACIGSVYDACTVMPHGGELVGDLRFYLQNQPGFQEQFARENDAQRAVLVAVLEEGARTGVFAPLPDPDHAAQVLMTAFAGFFPPYACPAHPKPSTRTELEAGASALFDLLLVGLRRCS